MQTTTRNMIIAAALGATAAIPLAAIVQAAGEAATTAGAIGIDNFIFTPKNLTVKAGTTITWTNRDDIPHGIASANNAFKRSKALDTDDSFSFSFTTPGTYQYFCYLHPQMTGTIVVEADTGTGPAN
jgi:plastocyanin